eukprot:g7179.t1
MNFKALAAVFVALQCGVLLTQAYRPMGATRKVLDSGAFQESSTHVESDDPYGFASGKLQIVGRDGKVYGKTVATSEALSDAVSEIKEEIDVAIEKVEDGADVEAVAKAAARATGYALAIAKAKTLVVVESDSKENKACGTATADAKAEAEAVVKAIAKVFAKAENEDAAVKIKEEEIAIQEAYAKAVTKSEAKACVTGIGYTKAQQVSLAGALAEVFAEAYAEAFAVIDDKDVFAKSKKDKKTGVDEEKSEVVSEHDSKVTGEGFADTFTVSDAFTITDFP